MSDNTARAPKVYVPKSSAKARQTSIGEILRISFKVEDAIEFFKKNANDKGYINLELIPRKTAGTYGDTHTLTLDTWKPTPRTDGAPARTTTSAKPASKAKTAPAAASNAPDEDDIPF